MIDYDMSLYGTQALIRHEVDEPDYKLPVKCSR